MRNTLGTTRRKRGCRSGVKVSAGRMLSAVGLSLAVLFLLGCSGEPTPQASPSASAGVGDTLRLNGPDGLSLAVTLLAVKLAPSESPAEASPGSSFLGVRLAIRNNGSRPYEAELGDCVSMVGPVAGGYQQYSPVQGDLQVDGERLPNAVDRLVVAVGASQTVRLWFPGWERSNYRIFEFVPTGDWNDGAGDWRLDR
jgi:hypothetical protein